MKFHKTKALLCTLCAVFLSSAFAALPAKAATAFDPHYYFAKYPDVANVTGFDPQALFDHYQAHGMAEGRFANSQAEWRDAAGIVDTEEQRTAFLMQYPAPDPNNDSDPDLPKFDAVFYYNTYVDVAEVIGGDPVALLNHYFAYGYSEGRLPFYGAEPCTEVQTSL
ncbi:MAG: hypothetical protein KH452_05825 [Clostridiales bacterium]|nr:hypothetical protein [Clostridiales bacterium]